jgi:metallo-beta-lactamase class B
MKTYGMDQRDEVKRMPLDQKAETWLANPWLLYHRPFRMVDKVYFVGTDWVSVFLLDTSEGLVLIDCAMQETWYLIVDNIRKLGFDPHNIRKLLLTHGHFDHCGAARAVQEMSGCETWISEKDAYFFTERRDLINCEDHVPEFRIDHYYDYDSVISCGDIEIKPVLCSGHTPGTTSLFFDVVHNGRKVTCGIHGGLGSGVLSRKMLDRQRWPYETQQIYLDNLDKVMDQKVDVLLPSHAKHAVDHDIYAIADADDGSGDGFIDPTAWKRMLTGKKKEMLDMMAKGL